MPSRRNPSRASRHPGRTSNASGSDSKWRRSTMWNGARPNGSRTTTVKTTKKAAQVQEGSGNVFADLGLRNPQELLARAQLAHRICQVIASRKLSQAEAAAAVGLDQPKISALMHGKLK